MKKNLFEMGAKFDDSWNSDNKQKKKTPTTTNTKAPNKHNLTTQKEKRRGKTVTVVREFFIPKDELKSLLKSLKKSLGCGGTIKENSLEFQGDIANKVREELIKRDYKFKISI